MTPDNETCRAYEVDGEPVSVRGGRDLDETEQGHLAEIVRAARHKHREDKDRERAEHEAAIKRAEKAEAELARLREGESQPPAGRPAAAYTPAEWLYDWNRQTPDERLATIDRIYEASRLMAACILEHHEDRLTTLPDLIRVAVYVSGGRGFVDTEPYPDALARRALGALDDATIQAALNQEDEQP